MTAEDFPFFYFSLFTFFCNQVIAQPMTAEDFPFFLLLFLLFCNQVIAQLMTSEDFDRRKKEGIERLEKEVKIYFIAFYFILFYSIYIEARGHSASKTRAQSFFP